MVKRQRRRRQERRRRHAQSAGWQTRHSVITGVGLAAGAALGMTSAAQAFTTYSYVTVGSTADTTGAIDCADPANTDCTLRQALIDAKTTPHFPLVLFQSGVTGTITVGSPLEITSSLAIYGPGSSALTVSGNHASRVLSVAGADVRVNGLTIADGQADGNGGGIEVKDAHFFLRFAV